MFLKVFDRFVLMAHSGFYSAALLKNDNVIKAGKNKS